jgi:rubrerythrin|tara:strand:+ start:488 stop:622 length:135 start_codon:yes stop_codon:yes gene_type:complete
MSSTQQNLESAFAEGSQSNRKYPLSADKPEDDGQPFEYSAEILL